MVNDDKTEPIPSINGHIHTPWSFSAFENMEQAFKMAADEGITALGINDFNTFAGYPEFEQLSLKYRIYPLYNVEFMGLMQEEQRKNVRINDPANPGRIYFSGKGMDHPCSLSGKLHEVFERVFQKSNEQTKAMLQKASDHLQQFNADLTLEYEEVMNTLTKGMLRERHIAKAIRLAVFAKYQDENARKKALMNIFDGKALKSSISDTSQLDNEIRGNLLKSGGAAYIQEGPEAFLPLETIMAIIDEGGGIACYPVLLDDASASFTEFEEDFEKLYSTLTSRGIFSLELIPGRNDFDWVTRFVEYFHERGFLITFGTEHNSPGVFPLTITTRGNKPLDGFLKKINFEGACLIAAHQQLRSKGDRGLTADQWTNPENRNKHIEYGAFVISEFCGLPLLE